MNNLEVQENNLKNLNSSEELIKREPLTDEFFLTQFRKLNLKVTSQRMAIFKTLASDKAHLTTVEIYERVKKVYPELGSATVYRFLRALSEKGCVSEIRMGGLPARYELTCKDPHDHLTCEGCGKIVEFQNQEIHDLQQSLSEKHNFKITGHILEFYGLCVKCQKQ